MSSATIGKKEQAARERRSTTRAKSNGRPETMEEIGLGGLIPTATVPVEAGKKKSTPAKGKPAKGKPDPDPDLDPAPARPKRSPKPKPEPEPDPAPPPQPEPEPDEAPEKVPDVPQGEPSPDSAPPPISSPDAPQGEPEAPEAPGPADSPGAWGYPPGEIVRVTVPEVEAEVEIRELTPDERADLERCERVIQAGFSAFVDSGLAIEEVRAKKLYCYKYKRFEDYVQARWQCTYRQAVYMISSAVEVKRLESLGVPPEELPTSLRAARELTRVPEEDREAVIRAANDLARSHGKPGATEREVRRATEATGRRTGKSAPQPDEVIPREVARAQRNGSVPAGTVMEISQVNPDAPEAASPSPEEVFDRAKYLDQFPIRQHLGKDQLALFDAEAIVYQRIEQPRKLFILSHTAPAIQDERNTLHKIGPYSVRIQYALRLPDPSQWVLCESCQGAGLGEIEGKVIECTDCKGDGFFVRAVN